jgi:DNA mismatch repair protein MutS2
MEAGRIRGRGIEWDVVRALLAREARTPMGRERATTIEPLVEATAVRSAVEFTRQARLALADAGSPPLDGLPDARPALDRCRIPGSVLDGVDLIGLLPTLEAGPRVTAWARTARPVAPDVVAMVAALPKMADLADALHAALDQDGAVKDDASPRLRQLRHEVRDRRRRLVGDLERLLQTPDADRVFADRYVTLRHGRYVLPVRAEARGRLKGIVHDRSQSGQTLFVEPTDAVDANNDLVQVTREEEQETARILAALTDDVRARLPALDTLVDTLGQLDTVCAGAHLAERMRATVPVVSDERTLVLRGARHPALLAQQWEDAARPVVPVDLELSAERPLLVVTGPNAGGKTIALKTLALCVLMAQSGLHVPAEDGSVLPVFSGLHAIIGDDQSVAENLSTFSAFIKQVLTILKEADDRSLVLLDELGAGTDPDEGAALAQAVLEELAERGALVMATTHLEPLKAFASTHPRARNAAVEFDSATLAPTFRLRYDRPGQSLALTIAARLGISADLISRAESHRSMHAARLSELLRWLDEYTRCEADRTIAIERREQEAAARLAAAREAEANAERKAQDLLSRAKAEATQLLTDIRRAVSAEWERLRKVDRSRTDLDTSRRRLREAAARVAPEEAPPASAPLTPGARVVANHLGVNGELMAISGDTATVRSGSMTVRVPVVALRLAEGDRQRRERSTTGWGVAATGNGGSRAGAPNPELLLLGRTTDEARDMVEQYLDDAFMAGLPTVRLVHGKGTGALRKAVRDLLAAHPLVESYRDGEPAEGGAGATVAALKVT